MPESGLNCLICAMLLKKRESGEDDEADIASVEEEAAFTLVIPRHFQIEGHNVSRISDVKNFVFRDLEFKVSRIFT